MWFNSHKLQFSKQFAILQLIQQIYRNQIWIESKITRNGLENRLLMLKIALQRYAENICMQQSIGRQYDDWYWYTLSSAISMKSYKYINSITCLN